MDASASNPFRGGRATLAIDRRLHGPELVVTFASRPPAPSRRRSASAPRSRAAMVSRIRSVA